MIVQLFLLKIREVGLLRDQSIDLLLEHMEALKGYPSKAIAR